MSKVDIIKVKFVEKLFCENFFIELIKVVFGIIIISVFNMIMLWCLFNFEKYNKLVFKVIIELFRMVKRNFVCIWFFIKFRKYFKIKFVIVVENEFNKELFKVKEKLFVL